MLQRLNIENKLANNPCTSCALQSGTIETT